MKSRSTVLKVYEPVKTDYFTVTLDVFAILGLSIALYSIFSHFRQAGIDTLKIYIFLSFLCIALISFVTYDFMRTYLRKIVVYEECIQVVIGFKRSVIRYLEIEEMDVQKVIFRQSRSIEKYNTIILFFGDNRMPLLDEVYNPNDIGEILSCIFKKNPHIKCSQEMQSYLSRLNNTSN